jgi:hypothetical protein
MLLNEVKKICGSICKIDLSGNKRLQMITFGKILIINSSKFRRIRNLYKRNKAHVWALSNCSQQFSCMYRRALLLSLFIATEVSGQTLPDSIVIFRNTYANSFDGGDNLYDSKKILLIRNNEKIYLNNRRISKAKVLDLLKELKNQENQSYSLSNFGLDTVWIKQNPEELLKLYSDKRRVVWNKEQTDFIYQKLTNLDEYVKAHKKQLSSGCCYTMHHSYKEQYDIQVFNDGISNPKIKSRKFVWGYWMPWTSSQGDTVYNSNLETNLRDVLKQKRGKAISEGNPLLKSLVNSIVDYYMPTLYELSAYTYLNEIGELQDDFEVVSFEEVYGRGRYIWNEPKAFKIVLKNEKMLPNVYLNFIASKTGKTIYSRDSLKADYKGIISRIQSIDFIREFLSTNTKAKLDIYYFNNRGINDYNIDSYNKNPEEWGRYDAYVKNLDWYKTSNIEPSFDLDKAIETSQRLHCGCNFRFDRDFVEQSIFFEIHDEDGNSSIWFLMPDGNVLLYLMQGRKVLNYSYSEFGNLSGLQYPCVLFAHDGQIISIKGE